MAMFRIFVKFQKFGDDFRTGQYTTVQAATMIDAIQEVLAMQKYNQASAAEVTKAEKVE